MRANLAEYYGFEYVATQVSSPHLQAYLFFRGVMISQSIMKGGMITMVRHIHNNSDWISLPGPYIARASPECEAILGNSGSASYQIVVELWQDTFSVHLTLLRFLLSYF